MGTDIVRSKVELDLADGRIVKLSDLTAALAKPAERPKAPEVIPLPSLITPAQREALSLLPVVYGGVVPTEKRQLTPTELAQLLVERATLDTIGAMAEARKADIRTTVVNHFDKKLEASDAVTDETWVDREGHYVVAAKEPVMGTTQSWSWEERPASAPNLTELMLKDLANDPESGFSKEDYLACTAQVRVVDENKLMLHLKKNPQLAHIFAKVLPASGAKTGALYVRGKK
jgi:hypothetical protein